jgi:peptidoglycan hydrolase-like protein with peptidoglycan-binding domain
MQTAAGKPAVKKSIIRDVGESHMVKKEFPLKKGSRGELVRKAQIYMNEQGIQPPLKTDGIFGPKTEAAALKVFKNKFIGEKVWQDKMSTPPVDITQQISWRAKNINLAKNIWNDDEEAVYTALEGLNKQQKEALETYFKERYQVNMWAFIGAFLNTQELNEAKRIYAAT